MRKLSNAIQYSQRVLSLHQNFCNFQCLCGCNTLIVSKEAYNTRQIKKCRCSRARQTNLIAECPSDGCLEYLKFIQNRYSFQWDEMKWGYLSPSDFILGPLYAGQITNKFYIKNLLCSEGPVENSLLYVKKTHQDAQYFKNSAEDWKLFSCKVCQMWVYAIETTEKIIAIPTNNRISKKRMNGLLQFKMGSKVSIKAPVMRKINLEEIYN
jgi:hypothetical protein